MKASSIFISTIVVMIVCMAMIKKNPQSSTIHLGFGGDTMLGRMVNETLEQLPTPERYYYCWGNMLPILSKNDLNIVNLETAITLHQRAVLKVFNFKTNPNHAKALTAANIHVVNIANNHIRDFDIQGMLDTIEQLDHAQIKHVGAGVNKAAAQKPAILTKKGIKIGVIGMTDNEPTWVARPDTPGTFYVKVGDIETVKPAIAQLRSAVDIVIVSIHWGPNMQLQPSTEFREFAHQLVDIGVDIIHGHSAHVVQGVEVYKNKLIMYDTGNFVDDYAIDPELRNDLSCFFVVTIKNGIVYSVELIPTQIHTMQVNQATGRNRSFILERIRKLSAELNTSVHGTVITIVS